jgi:hypothetical protein
MTLVFSVFHFRTSLFCLGMERSFELLAFGFAERSARALIDNLVQFVQVHGDPAFIVIPG